MPESSSQPTSGLAQRALRLPARMLKIAKLSSTLAVSTSIGAVLWSLAAAPLASRKAPAPTTQPQPQQELGQPVPATPTAVERALEPLRRLPLRPLPVGPPSRAKGAPASARVPSSAVGLHSELEVLRQVERALRQDEPARALRLLERLAREVPNGPLGEERAAAQLIAVCDLGRDPGTLADEFLARYRASAYARRVELACERGAAAPVDNGFVVRRKQIPTKDAP